MRKSIFIAILLVVCGIIHGYGQGIAVYPTPSYNILVDGYANFRQSTLSQPLFQPAEKRVLDVEVKTPSTTSECQATVWVYSLDNLTVLGPFTVNCSEPLQVVIDEKEWGVLIDTDEELIVSVSIN
jgi:hypothetical protein